jgi:glycolate oxidase
MDQTITAQLSEIVGEEDLSTSPFERTLYSHDAAPVPGLLSLFFKTTPDIIVRPESAGEVAQILRLASDHRDPVIPRAAASWSLGGVTPVKGGIVLDLVKLNKIGEVLSTDGLWVEVEAGVVWQDLIEQLLEEGLTVLSYPTSAPSSTVGGWVSTGGYGIGSLKFGHIGEQIEAIEVVTPTGEIQTVSRGSADPKMEWFFGTEGQLGVITKVRLRIRHLPEKTAVRGVYVAGNEELAELVSEFSRIKAVPYCLKVLDSGLMALKNLLDNRENGDRNFVLAEFEGSAEEVSDGTAAFDQIVKQRGLQPVDQELAEAKWQERLYPMRIGRLGPTLLGGETVIPIEQLAPVLSDIQSLKEEYNLKMGTEAHVVSKERVAVLALYLADERKALSYLTKLAVIRDIIRIGLSHGGKPHGLGLWGAVYVKRQLGKEDLGELRGVKKRFDPEGILNPGKFFRADTRFGIPITMPLYSTMMSVLSLAGRFQ